MIPPQNLSLLKGSLPPAQPVHYNAVELKAAAKQKDLLIAESTKRVEAKREEMKNLSKNINSLIEKQLKKPSKQRPSFNITYSNQRLSSLHNDKNKIFAEIERIKQEIKLLQVGQPESIVEGIFAGQAKMQQLQAETANMMDSKQLLTKALQQNKGILDRLQESGCLKDLENKETEFQSIKRECKRLEKEINIYTAEELQRNSYFLQIKARFEKEILEEPFEEPVDENQLKQLVEDINQTYEERRLFEKQMVSKMKTSEKRIADLEKSIKEKQVLIRQVQKNVLRASLESKRITSMVLLREYSTKKTIFRNDSNREVVKQKQKNANPEEKKAPKRIINKIYMIQKDDLNCIYVGEWLNESKSMSDRLQIPPSTIQHIKTLTFSLTNGRVVGVKATYKDKNNILIQGKELTIFTQPLQVEMKIEISLDDVLQLEYSIKSEDLYVRFFLANGSWKELGQRGIQVEKINLEPYFFKTVQIQANQAHTSIAGLKILLEEKPTQQKLGLSDVSERTTSQMSYSNNFQSPMKKKVILKGRSLKKIKQQPIIDHRLLLNKHK